MVEDDDIMEGTETEGIFAGSFDMDVIMVVDDDELSDESESEVEDFGGEDNDVESG